MIRRALLLVALSSPAFAQPTDPAPTPSKELRDAKDAKRPKYESKVRADKADSLRRASGSKTTITHEEIERAQPDNTGEMLRRVPGLQVRQEDQSGFRLNLGVRGLSPVRSRLVLLEEDGVPVVVSPYGEPELYYTTSVERIKSIDVIKGAEVLRYGPQTVGAVIQLHTFDPTPTPTWYVGATAGTQGYYSTMARYANTTPSGVGYVLQAYYKRADGVRAMAFQAADAMGKLRIPTGHGTGELMIKAAAHYDLAGTTYTGLTDTLYANNPRANTIAPHDDFGVQRYEIAVAHDQHFGHGATTTKLHTAFFAYEMNLTQRTQDYNRSCPADGGFASIPDPNGLCFYNTTGIRNRYYTVIGASEELEQRFSTGFVHHKLVLGARLMFDTARRELDQGTFPTANTGNLLGDSRTYIFGLGAWIEDQLALTDWLLVTPAFRLEHSNTTQVTRVVAMAPPSSAFSMPPTNVFITQHEHVVARTSANGPMPGIGVVLGKPTLNAFTSFYLGYSGPRVSQAITPEGTDSQVKAEHSTNWEVGLRGRAGTWLSAEADTFILNFDNQLVSNNPFYNPQAGEVIDGGHTQHIGAEGTINLRFGRLFKLPIELDVAGHYTFARSRFVGGFATSQLVGDSINGKTVPYSPAHNAVATLDITHRIGIGGQVAFSYVGSQYSDEQNNVGPADAFGLTGRIPAYTTLDFALRYRERHTGLSLSVSMKNALNRVYISDRLPNGIFTAGFREVFATLAWSSGS